MTSNERCPADPISTAQYWDDLYREGAPGWDKGRAAPPIVRMVDEGRVPPGRVIVLGAGRGHDALLLARRGFAVTAVDFAPVAAEAMRDAAKASGLPLVVLQEDLFALPSRFAGVFDAVLEHTSFCAISPARRDEYVRVVDALLVAGGIYFGLFYAHGRAGGPPFDTSRSEIEARFASRFELTRLETAQGSLPERAGAEIEFLFRKRPV